MATASVPAGARARGLLAWTPLVVMVALLGLVAVVLVRSAPDRADPLAAYLVADPSAAPALALTGPDGAGVDLRNLRGLPVLVFFGYTHCPDVCPTTIGEIVTVLGAYGPRARALYVTIDPERDTVEWLAGYARYLPGGITPLTGTADRIGEAAAAWGVRYARVEAGDGDYAMSHTADLFLVDPAGRLRGRFPFGTDAATIVAALQRVAPADAALPDAAPASAASPQAAASGFAGQTDATPAPAADGLQVELTSTSVWAGPPAPIILRLSDATGGLDGSATVGVQVRAPDGSDAGPSVPALAVRPPGIEETSYVASVDLPSPGAWVLAVTATTADGAITGTLDVTARDPGSTAAIGAPAPTLPTPTLDDVGGVARAITTDPMPDLRLSRWSTRDALAERRPFVLIVDSPRFKVSQECGRAVLLGRYLLDRWPEVRFIHLEPLRYSLLSDTPSLHGTLEAPLLNDAAAAWGIGGSPWGPRSMPWIFVVDADGVVRARYFGVIGTDDVDVILSMLAAEP